MKPLPKRTFSDAADADEAARTLLRELFAECCRKADALCGHDDAGVHAFRLSCKRLRHAIERANSAGTYLDSAKGALAKITDALGAAHDCVVLIGHAARCRTDLLQPSIARDRDAHLAEGRRLWAQAREPNADFAALVAFTTRNDGARSGR